MEPGQQCPGSFFAFSRPNRGSFRTFARTNQKTNTMTEHLSNDSYIEGLKTMDTEVLEAIYNRYRYPVVRAVAALGGSEATGRVFFQVALIQAFESARSGALPAGLNFFDQLKYFALSHYRDWLAERGQAPTGEEWTEGDNAAEALPSEALRQLRKKMVAWRKSEQREDEDPTYFFWEKTEKIERHLAEGAPPPLSRRSRFWRAMLVSLGLVAAGYGIYRWYESLKMPAKVYEDNFTPPESIVADLRLRYGNPSGPDSATSVPASRCAFLLREADAFYQVKDYSSVEALLVELLNDTASTCHSDALFYLGIVSLAKEEPGMALQCFSKIEDLEHFGEDIYWYQALAFVQLAKKNPLFRDKAVQAVERARSNAQDSIRRMQAEKMMEQLDR
jgi:hypothetical protein